MTDLGRSGGSLTYESFRDEMRKYVRPDVPDEAIRELWEAAREAGHRAAEVADEPTSRGQSARS